MEKKIQRKRTNNKKIMIKKETKLRWIHPSENAAGTVSRIQERTRKRREKKRQKEPRDTRRAAAPTLACKVGSSLA